MGRCYTIILRITLARTKRVCRPTRRTLSMIEQSFSFKTTIKYQAVGCIVLGVHVYGTAGPCPGQYARCITFATGTERGDTNIPSSAYRLKAA